ncbi:MAG: SRPBCC family protein [Verrucomicrobiota bacterium]
MTQTLAREQIVHQPRAEVFAFYANAANLERLTPASLRFEICGPLPPTLVAGTIIDYRLSLLGVPFAWRTLIEEFQSPTRFVDVQLKGPYRSWRHVHEFSDVMGGTATLVRDHVEYQLPFGRLGALLGRRFVERQLKEIFDFRRDTLTRIFPRSSRI